MTTNVCVGGVKAHGLNQQDRGGSIPASTLHLWFNEDHEAERLVKSFHYSKRWPSNVQFVVTAHESGGLFGTKGDAVAAVVFSIPPTRWSIHVLELSRLVRHEERQVSLSWLIGHAIRQIKKRGLAELLVSFADAQQGHHGGVYRAANWRYAGQRRPSMEGVIVDGVFTPGRSANSRWGTRSPKKLAELGIDATAKWDEGKHLYWYPVTSKGDDAAKTVGLTDVDWKHSQAGER